MVCMWLGSLDIMPHEAEIICEQHVRRQNVWSTSEFCDIEKEKLP